MTVNDVYQIILYVVNKQQSAYVSPDQFNLIINQAQTSYQQYLLGEFQQYQYGPQGGKARIQYSQNSVIRQRLQPLIYGYILNVDATGFSSYPGDYVQTDSMLTMYGNNRIRYSQQDTQYSFLNSQIDPVSANPIYLIEDIGFRFYPNNINQTRLNYIRKPTRIFWAFTLNPNGLPIYDPVNSENPIWSDVDMLEIISRALRMVGVNLQSADVSQYANEIKNSGQ